MNAELTALVERLTSRPRSPDLAERRKALDQLGTLYPLPEDVRIETIDFCEIVAEWTTTPDADTDAVMLFLHGGGFVAGSLESHRHLFAEAGRRAGMCSFAPAYRLAPEHPFPAAIEDSMKAYRFLLAQGFRPKRIVIAGDSAGAALAVSTMLAIREAGLTQPACGWCISPWVDLEGTGGTMQSKAAVDPLIKQVHLLELAALYLNASNPHSPLASPLHAELAGLPPLLIQVGSAETLLDDSLRLAGAAGASGVRVTLEIWPEMIHAWPLFHPDLAEGRHAIAKAALFIRHHANT